MPRRKKKPREMTDKEALRRLFPPEARKEVREEAKKAQKQEEKKDDAAIAAAKAPARHFDRVVIIVLENGDYEEAVQDKNLAALATKGASFSNFHALFHP